MKGKWGGEQSEIVEKKLFRKVNKAWEIIDENSKIENLFITVYNDRNLSRLISVLQLKVMMTNLDEYLEEEQLTLNSKKSIVMELSKCTGRWKMTKWKWKGIQLESAIEFLYSGVLFQINGNIAEHLKGRVKRLMLR